MRGFYPINATNFHAKDGWNELFCNGGYHIVCTYRSQEGLGQILCSTGGTYAQPQDDGRVRGYSFYLTH